MKKFNLSILVAAMLASSSAFADGGDDGFENAEAYYESGEVTRGPAGKYDSVYRQVIEVDQSTDRRWRKLEIKKHKIRDKYHMALDRGNDRKAARLERRYNRLDTRQEKREDRLLSKARTSGGVSSKCGTYSKCGGGSGKTDVIVNDGPNSHANGGFVLVSRTRIYSNTDWGKATKVDVNGKTDDDGKDVIVKDNTDATDVVTKPNQPTKENSEVENQPNNDSNNDSNDSTDVVSNDETGSETETTKPNGSDDDVFEPQKPEGPNPQGPNVQGPGKADPAFHCGNNNKCRRQVRKAQKALLKLEKSRCAQDSSAECQAKIKEIQAELDELERCFPKVKREFFGKRWARAAGRGIGKAANSTADFFKRLFARKNRCNPKDPCDEGELPEVIDTKKKNLPADPTETNSENEGDVVPNPYVKKAGSVG